MLRKSNQKSLTTSTFFHQLGREKNDNVGIGERSDKVMATMHAVRGDVVLCCKLTENPVSI